MGVGIGARWSLASGLSLVLGCGDDLPSLVESSTTASPGAPVTGDEGTTASGTTASGTPTTGEVSHGTTTTTDEGTTAPGEASSGGGTSTGPGTGTSSGEGTSTGSDAGTSSGGGTSDGSESGTTGGLGEPVCIDEDLGSALVTTFGDTSLATDDWQPPCTFGLGGPDRGHRFTAPVDGFYAFDTLATVGLDTVLYAFEGEACEGPAVVCNDDVALGQVESRISMFLPQDAPVVVVVDGWDATQAGPYALDVDAVLGPCASVDLGAVPEAYVAADNTGELDKLQGSCAAAPGRDVMLRWIVPYDGTFVIDTLDSSFDTVLYLRAGSCGSLELACNDDAMGGVQSRIVAALTMGTELTVVVDGFGLGATGPLAVRILPQ